MDALLQLFSAGEFLPHSICLLARRDLVWLHAVSDGVTAASYYSIPVALSYFAWKRQDLVFKRVFLLFAAFILACGTTHVMGVVTLWVPEYGIDGLVKAVTALLSVVTAILLWPLMPQALALPSPSQLARVNRELEREIVERRDAQAEIARKNAELETLLARLSELDRLKSDFFANVSHELRTPLTLVLGPCEQLLDQADKLSAEQQRDLQVIRRNATTLLHRVSDLLDIAKLDAGQMRPQLARADLARHLRLVAGHFESLAKQRRIAFPIEAPPTLIAEFDAAHVERMVLNLLGNAFKFVPDGGRIACRLRRDETHAELIVDDSGPGVPAEQREKIFDRFHQLEGGTRRRHGGTGLGLAIVRELVMLHAGSIVADEAPGGGARFVLRLPLAAAPGSEVAELAAHVPELTPDDVAAHAGAPLRQARPAEAGGEAGGGAADTRAVVVIAEDHDELRRFIADALQPEARVVSAADGEQAWTLIRQLRPDCVVTDIMMPRVSGDELLARLRGDAALAEVPVLVLSARADDVLRVRLLSAGAADYLTKPFATEELRTRCRNLIQAKRARDLMRGEISGSRRDLVDLARELAARKRELETVADALRAARDQAVAALDVRGRFLRLLSHELRAPLTAIQLHLGLLRRSANPPLSETQLTYVGGAESAARRLGHLVTSLLEYARLESGRFEVRIAPCDVAALAAEVVAEMRPRGEEKGIAVALECAAPLAPVATDAALLQLVLVNLVDNAVKYTESGGVTLHLEDLGDARRIEVRDTGPGIAEADLDALFMPFHQIDNVDHKHRPGVGLGLSLARQLVDALGGRMDIVTRPGAGSSFAVTLPVENRETYAAELGAGDRR